MPDRVSVRICETAKATHTSADSELLVTTEVRTETSLLPKLINTCMIYNLCYYSSLCDDEEETTNTQEIVIVAFFFFPCSFSAWM